MTDYKPIPQTEDTDSGVLVEKTDSNVLDPNHTSTEKTTSGFPRLLKIGLMSFVVGFTFSQLLLHYAIPRVYSYFHPSPKPWNYDDFRPPTTYSGTDHVTAKVCVTTVPPRDVSRTKKLKVDELAVADMMVMSAIWRKVDPGLADYMFMPYHCGPLRLWVTKADYPDCSCEKKKGCLHLKTAAYQGFKQLHKLNDGNLPGVQCIAARDSLGNEIAFAWGTDDDEVFNATCAYDEDKADEVYEVGEGLEVTRVLL